METLFEVLAGGVVVAHMTFVVFVALGGFLSLRWPGAAWVHVPAAIWGAFVELTGQICPLTPLENALRARADLDPYAGDFVSRQLLPALYPAGLTRDVQMVLGGLAIVVNIAVYVFVYLSRASDRA